ncbi:hypothetical protein KI387_012868, partial [Taxus chinensis]
MHCKQRTYLFHLDVPTRLAFKYFSQRGFDIAVVEIGLGCARDATNVIHNKRLVIVVIAEIGKEHMDALGGLLGNITILRNPIKGNLYQHDNSMFEHTKPPLNTQEQPAVGLQFQGDPGVVSNGICREDKRVAGKSYRHGEFRFEQGKQINTMCGLDGFVCKIMEKALDDRTIGHNPEHLGLLIGLP